MEHLYHLDSTIKEAMRTRVFTTISLGRIVVAEEEILLPDRSHVPTGANIAVPEDLIHHDESIYPDAFGFKPFRHILAPEDMEDECQPMRTASQSLEEEDKLAKAMSPVMTGPNYVSSGHGRHSCPGRFLAMCDIKSVLACMLQSFDFEVAHAGVAQLGNDEFCSPGFDTTIMFRLRR